MQNLAALKAAIDLLQVPSRTHAARLRALPDGVGHLLSIAAGDEAATTDAARSTRRSPSFLRKASLFFIEQILLSPVSDSYRVLGADRTATSVELRRNMALLLKILHPDHYLNSERSIFVGRVTEAWNNLKTLERRCDYDAFLAAMATSRPVRPVSSMRSATSFRTAKKRRALRHALLDFLAHFRV